MTDAPGREVGPDDMAAFHHALPAHLARAFTLDHVTIPALRAALEHAEPHALAKLCAVGIRSNTVNRRGLILYRLRRTAGLLDDGGA